MNYVGGDAEAWWKLEKRIRGALDVASDDLRDRHHRSLKLGSPVLVGQAGRDIIRVPIILLGGPRELSLAYVQIGDVRVDNGRIKTLAQRASALARQAIENAGPPTGDAVLIAYP